MKQEDIDKVCRWIKENTHYTTFERVSNFGIKIDDIRLVFDYDSHAEVIEALKNKPLTVMDNPPQLKITWE